MIHDKFSLNKMTYHKNFLEGEDFYYFNGQ